MTAIVPRIRHPAIVAPPQEPPAPDAILGIATGFMSARHLFVAAEVGLFAALADGPRDLDQLASATELPRRTARITADVMVALGLVERNEHGRYANGAAVQHYLAGSTPADFGPLLRYFRRLSYPAWEGLGAAIRSGGGVPTSFSPQDVEVFGAGVEAITAGAARALAGVPELREARRLLDVGGGTGSFLVPALTSSPSLTATLWDLPDTAANARRRLARTPVAGRIDVRAGDARVDAVPADHDAVLLANLIHLLRPHDNRALLARLAEACPRDALLLLVDFWTDPSHTDPPIAPIMAGEFLLVGGDGDVYSVNEVREWLEATGWRFVEHRPLAGAQTLIVARSL